MAKLTGEYTATSIQDYKAHKGMQGLEKVVKMADKDVLDTLLAANLNGRGGAAYPAGRKWKQLYEIEGDEKYIVCNGDEGEPGTFKDKILMSKYSLSVIEGMIIAGWIFKACRGVIYIRGEYRDIQPIFQEALDNARAAGYLGKNIMGIEGFNYDISITSGAGAYVCGENSALLNSIEGKAGRPRIKPPHLAEVGLYGKPTLVNNVESFKRISDLFINGLDEFLAMGTPDDGGAKLACVCGHAKNRAAFEVKGGTPIKDILYNEDMGGGTASGLPIKFCHMGGQSGPIAFPEQFDTPYDYKHLKDAGLASGSGAMVVMDESVCLVDYCKQVVEFFVEESCGKCTPCRIGTTRLLELLTDFTEGRAVEGDVEKLEYLANKIHSLSSCGLGQAADKALMSAIKYRRAEFEAHTKGKCPAGMCKFSEKGGR